LLIYPPANGSKKPQEALRANWNPDAGYDPTAITFISDLGTEQLQSLKYRWHPKDTDTFSQRSVRRPRNTFLERQPLCAIMAVSGRSAIRIIKAERVARTKMRNTFGCQPESEIKLWQRTGTACDLTACVCILIWNYRTMKQSAT
jgi:hypothetical protein